MIFEKAKVYGVDGLNGSNYNLLRTDSSVGLSYQKGSCEIMSDFDRCFPWSDITENVDGECNVFVRIPKFYSKLTLNSDGTYKLQISGTRYSGFSTLFVDGKGNELDYIDVGKYEGSGSSSKVFSKSGETILVNIKMDDFRRGCQANGKGYQQLDFIISEIINQLFIVEFATTNCQNIMRGYCQDNNAALITGHTDGLKTPSGSYSLNHNGDCTSCNTDGHHACKYRGIENPWGNVNIFCDGIAFDQEKVYVCFDPNSYVSGRLTMPYIYMGNRPTAGGHMSERKHFSKVPLLSYMTKCTGGDNSYYCDYTYYSDNGTVLLLGGAWYNGTGAGLWYYGANNTINANYTDISGRLCYKPL